MVVLKYLRRHDRLLYSLIKSVIYPRIKSIAYEMPPTLLKSLSEFPISASNYLTIGFSHFTPQLIAEILPQSLKIFKETEGCYQQKNGYGRDIICVKFCDNLLSINIYL